MSALHYQGRTSLEPCGLNTDVNTQDSMRTGSRVHNSEVTYDYWFHTENFHFNFKNFVTADSEHSTNADGLVVIQWQLGLVPGRRVTACSLAVGGLFTLGFVAMSPEGFASVVMDASRWSQQRGWTRLSSSGWSLANGWLFLNPRNFRLSMTQRILLELFAELRHNRLPWRLCLRTTTGD